MQSSFRRKRRQAHHAATISKKLSIAAWLLASAGCTWSGMTETEREYIDRTTPTPIPEGTAGSIQSGSVILYGRRLSPPFLFDATESRLTLNGVSVIPAEVPPWEPRDIVVAEAAAREMAGLAHRIVVRERLLRSASRGDRDRLLLEHVRQNEPGVASAEWLGPELLLLELTSDEEFFIDFSEGPAAGSPAPVESVRRIQREYEAALAAGAMLIIGHEATLTVPYEMAEDFEEELRTEMEDPSLQGLRDLVGSDGLARELMFVLQQRPE